MDSPDSSPAADSSSEGITPRPGGVTRRGSDRRCLRKGDVENSNSNSSWVSYLGCSPCWESQTPITVMSFQSYVFPHAAVNRSRPRAKCKVLVLYIDIRHSKPVFAWLLGEALSTRHATINGATICRRRRSIKSDVTSPIGFSRSFRNHLRLKAH